MLVARTAACSCTWRIASRRAVSISRVALSLISWASCCAAGADVGGDLLGVGGGLGQQLADLLPRRSRAGPGTPQRRLGPARAASASSMSRRILSSRSCRPLAIGPQANLPRTTTSAEEHDQRRQAGDQALRAAAEQRGFGPSAGRRRPRRRGASAALDFRRGWSSARAGTGRPASSGEGSRSASRQKLRRDGLIAMLRRSRRSATQPRSAKPRPDRSVRGGACGITRRLTDYLNETSRATTTANSVAPSIRAGADDHRLEDLAGRPRAGGRSPRPRCRRSGRCRGRRR